MQLTPSRSHLLEWSKTAAAKHLLPILIRKLIVETGQGLREVDFPGEEGTALHGCDGFVIATAPTAFVPEGRSLWEVSAKKSPGGKASSDIEKRTSVPDGSPVEECTYVAAILAPWEKRAEWARREREGRGWRDVKALGVDKIVAWLDEAPGAAAWLLEQMGFPAQGIITASTWWRRWSSATDPALHPPIVLLGRENEAQVVANRAIAPGVTSVGGELGPDEILACVVASGCDAGSLIDRMLMVEDRQAWRWLLRQSTPLTLITMNPAFLDDVDSDTPHSVIIPTAYASSADVVMPAIRAEEIVDVLRTHGFNPEMASDLGEIAARSLVAFRRRIARRQELMRPAWASGSPPRAKRAVLLATGWNDEYDADRRIVSAIAGCSYDQAKEMYLQLSSGSDPFLIIRDGRFHIVSAVDGWMLLGKHLVADDLKVFANLAVEVLQSLPRERSAVWDAEEAKKTEVSGALRRGLATSLALLGAYGDQLVVSGGRHGADWATKVVFDLLKAANADGSGQTWRALSPVLPLLAEASPRVFLDGVSSGLAGSTPVLLQMFDENPNDLLSSASSHTGLLWALEATAWSPDYFIPTVLSLARLAELDPGGRLANRPLASLSRILCAWRPETAATSSERLAAIDLVRRSTPDVAWDVMVRLLPKPHDTHFPTSGPRFRGWKPRREAVLRSEYLDFIDNLICRLAGDANDVPGRWKDLISAMSHLPRPMRDLLRAELSKLADKDIDAASKAAIWEQVRERVALHREYSDAQWALSEDELALWELAGNAIAPADPLRRHHWLFQNNRAQLGDVRLRDDYRAYEVARKERRVAAVSEIESALGITGIVQFAESVPEKRAVGVALGIVGGDGYLDLALDWLGSPESDTKRVLAEGFVWGLVGERGDDWAWRLVGERKGLSAPVQASVALCTRDAHAAIARMEELSPDVRAEYWRRFSYFGLGADFPDVTRVSEELVRVGRAASALHLLSLYSRGKADSTAYAEAIAASFEAMMSSGKADPELQHLGSHDFDTLFGVLDQHADELGFDRVTTIEWLFFPTLGFEPSQTLLHRRLATDPAFFVEIVSLVYLGENEERPAVTADEAIVRRAENAWRLLESWRMPPGLGVDGVLEIDRCRVWIRQAEALLEDAGRLAVGRQCIGAALVHSPRDARGTWPDEELRTLIEDLGTPDMLTGIERALFNLRGAHERALFEGGVQERKLAEQYRSQEVEFMTRWPRIAEVFGRLAELYEAEARREDEEAERRRRGIGR